MIRIDARIEGGVLSGIPVVATADLATSVHMNAMDSDESFECKILVEVDDDLNELRIIVDNECVYSTGTEQ